MYTVLSGLFTLCAATALVAAPQQTTPPDRLAMECFDLKRYMGEWYEIARYDHRFERGLTHVWAEYALRKDGMVAVTNSGFDSRTGQRREAHGKARVTDVPGRLEVSFFWIFYSPYYILELDADYRWVLVGSRSPEYLWILSRTPSLADETLAEILSLTRERGYDTSKLIFVSQSGKEWIKR